MASPPYVQIAPLPSPPADADSIVALAANVTPAPRQLAFHQLEFTCFVHFGINTFTGNEWGSGMEQAALFDPGETLDVDQWVRTAKAAEMKLVLITAKHHDGFCLWQTRYNDQFSVRAVPWRDGRGDILRDLAEACRKHGLKMGVYLSPADLYQIESATGLYGNGSTYQKSVIPTQPAALQSDPTTLRQDKPVDSPVFEVEVDDYNRYFMNQLYELLTEYGPISEVWFDGAHPKRKGNQQYTKQLWFDMIRALAPDAVIFGGPDVRWCGNEAGRTRQTEWNVIPVEGQVQAGEDRTPDDLGSRQQLVQSQYDVYGKKFQSRYLYYVLPEINTSIRAGWFWRNEHEQQVRTPDDVFDIYERAVGGNGVFLLNVPPDRTGRFAPRDVACLLEVGQRVRQVYGDNTLTQQVDCQDPRVLDGRLDTYWQPKDAQDGLILELSRPMAFNRVVLQEAIGVVGQRVEEHVVDARIDGRWQEVARGTTIGYKKILRFPRVTADALRLRIPAARQEPTIAEVRIHDYLAPAPQVAITRDSKGMVRIEVPQDANFPWNPHGQGDPSKQAEVRIHYTLDGLPPGPDSARYEGPLTLPDGGRVRAVAIVGESTGTPSERLLGITPLDWKIAEVSSELAPDHSADKAIDGDPATSWLTAPPASPNPFHRVVIDLGRERPLTGFTYLPRQDRGQDAGMVEAGELQFSVDGMEWSAPRPFRFCNLINDPSLRTMIFDGPPVRARYVAFVAREGAGGTDLAGAAELGFLAEPTAAP